MAQYRFVVNGDFVEFYDGSQHVFTVRNTTQDVDWYYETAPGINFEVDGHKYFTVPSQIEIDGVTLSANTEFDAAIVAIFPNLAGGGEGGITTVGNVGAGDAKGASISGNTIFLHKATETQPGLVSVDGTTQSFGGPKSWAGTQQFQNLVTFESIQKIKEVAAPSAPAAGYINLYAKTDKKLYYKDSDDLETEVGGTNLYTADGTLSGARALALNGNILTINQGANPFLSIDPATDAENITIQAYNTTDNDNVASLSANTTPTTSEARLLAAFNDLTKYSLIDLDANASASSITHNSETHNFATGDVKITALAGGGTTGLSIDNDGKIIRTP